MRQKEKPPSRAKIKMTTNSYLNSGNERGKLDSLEGYVVAVRYYFRPSRMAARWMEPMD
jgi:hypothetical protein